MTAAQRRLRQLLDRQSSERQRLAELSAVDELDHEQRSEFDRIEKGTPDLERQIRAARIAVDDERESREVFDDGESREFRSLQDRSRVGNYVAAALEGRAVSGAELELNEALGMGADRFPLRLLAPDPVEARATTDVDAQVTQQRWLDRLFADAAAMRLGITFESVGAGKASYPVTTGGATGAQRGRREAAADAAWTIGVSNLEPTRNAVRAVFSVEDAARLPGLEDALVRDLRMALTDSVDLAIFKGDDGANEDTADIVGLMTAENVVEVELTQANKAKGPETLASFAGLLDGKHAAATADLNVVSAVGANTLWLSTLANDRDMTIAQFLRANGINFAARGDIETATTAGKFAAFVGRARGIVGAGVAAVWDDAMLIRDPYTNASKGEVALTISHLWAFGLPRATNFARIKFVA